MAVLKLKDFTTELSTDRKERLDALQEPAQELEQRYEAFIQDYEDATADLSGLEDKKEQALTELTEIDAQVAVEIDFEKAKELRDKQNDLQLTLEVLESLINARKTKHTEILLNRAVAVFQQEDVYRSALSTFVSAVEVTTNFKTIKDDVEAVNTAESFYINKHNSVGAKLIKFGLYPQYTKRAVINGKSYSLTTYGSYHLASQLRRVEDFFRQESRYFNA